MALQIVSRYTYTYLYLPINFRIPHYYYATYNLTKIQDKSEEKNRKMQTHRQLVQTFLALANKESQAGASTPGGARSEESCMFSVLSQLKEAGAQLEEEHRQDMDRVQEELIKLCQNREEDLEIRLMMLEIIEVLNTVNYLILN